jgi:hypothetical protein
MVRDGEPAHRRRVQATHERGCSRQNHPVTPADDVTFSNHLSSEALQQQQAGRHALPHPHGFGGIAVVIATLGCPGGRGRRVDPTPSSPPLLKRDSRSAQPPPAARRARRKTSRCGAAAAELSWLCNVRRCRLAGRVELSAAAPLSSAAFAPSAPPSAASAAARACLSGNDTFLLLPTLGFTTSPCANVDVFRPASSDKTSGPAPQNTQFIS